MNDNFGYIDIVLLAIVAGIIILRLRNVLGKGAEDSAIRAKKSVIVDAQFEDVKSSKVEENINTKEFKEDTFLKGAQAAYEMIVNAFASADKKTLKDLTSPEVYKSFVSVLDDRKNKKLLNQFTFSNSVKIRDCKLFIIILKCTIIRFSINFFLIVLIKPAIASFFYN